MNWKPPKTDPIADLDAAVEMIREDSKRLFEPTYIHPMEAKRAQEYINKRKADIMKPIEITQELLARLTFTPVPKVDRKTDYDKYRELEKSVFSPGNVIKVDLTKGRWGIHDKREYLLVGHVNEESGWCDDCTISLEEEVISVANIFELFERA